MKVTRQKLKELKAICGSRDRGFEKLEQWAVRAQAVPPLIDEIERLYKVLEFYAARESWEPPTRTAPAILDEGRKAREAMEGI